MMSRQSTTITLISVIAALVLYSIASYFEDDTRWDLQVEGADGPRISARTRIESPLETISAAENCQRAERELVDSVVASQYCSADDDCTIFDYGYPIQCLTSVAKSEITALRLDYRRYAASCDFRVFYDCPTGNLDRRAVCRGNRCEVELVGIEALEDETLDHLGIDQSRRR